MKKYLFYLLLALAPTTYPTAIIFDLCGVLMYPNRTAMIQQIGLKRLLDYSACASLLALEEEFFTFLESIKPRRSPILAYKNDTQEVPQIFNDWLDGTLRSGDIQALIQEHARTYYDDQEQQEMAIMLGSLIFNPVSFARTLYIHDESIALVQLCKYLGHRVYILSNLDTQTYEELKDLYPEFWDLFDGVLISGSIGYNKPDPYIYECALKTFNTATEDTILIDDTPQNIVAAQKLGIFGIVCKQTGALLQTIPYITYAQEVLLMHLDSKMRNKITDVLLALAV